MRKNLTSTFQQETSLMRSDLPSLNTTGDGSLVIVTLPLASYPSSLQFDHCKLKRLFGDSLLRVKWRSKLAYDHFSLMKLVTDTYAFMIFSSTLRTFL